ncbi:putative tRNA guanylyltransferase-like protein, partial [Tribonema minus]
MAKSRFEYVRNFELADSLVPGCCIVVRVDGHKFTRFTKTHSFDKPNDSRGLQLMNEVQDTKYCFLSITCLVPAAAFSAVLIFFSFSADAVPEQCAKAVMLEWSDIVMAYGQSDEYSFLLPAWSDLYNRRASKLSSSFASLFASSYVFLWPKFFGDAPLQSAPAFDGRAIAYPTPAHVRDYFAWRQADCHINNLYNTAFWSIVKSGLSTQAREFACERPLLQALAGTSAAEKNELLFKRFGINYNNEPEMYRKGTVICRQGELALTRPNARNKKARARAEADARGDGTALATHHVDIIGEAFWAQRPALLRPDG